MFGIPDLIWSGVVGALSGAMVALVTTLLNNASHNRRHREQIANDVAQRSRQMEHDAEQRRIQLAHDSEQRRAQLKHDAEQRQLQLGHDADQKRLDRQTSIRKEVYLAALDATGRLQEYISNYAREDISPSERLKGLQGGSSAIAKVHLVGSNATIEAFSFVQLTFAKQVAQLEERRLEVASKVGEGERLKGNLQSLDKDWDRLLSENEPGEVLVSIKIEHRQLSHAQNELEDEILRLRMELYQASILANLELLKGISDAVVVTREDLGMELKADNYVQFVEGHSRRISEVYESFYRKLAARFGGVEGTPNPGPQPDVTAGAVPRG